MSTVAATTYDQLLDGIVAQLQPLTIPEGGSTSANSYLRVCKRYMGEKFSPEDAALRGTAGRTPAVLVAFAGEKPYRTTISRRKDRVEASFLVICTSDSRRSKDDRSLLFKMLGDVRYALGNKKLNLPIMPLRYDGIVVVAEDDTMFAYAARFKTRYVVDYTIDPGADLLLSAVGQIVAPTNPPDVPTAPILTVNGTPGTARYAYDVQVLYNGSPSSDFSAWTQVVVAPNALGGGNSIGVAWAAATGATGYVLRRRWSPAGGPAIGVIYTGTATSFTDDGSVQGDGNVNPARGELYQGEF